MAPPVTKKPSAEQKQLDQQQQQLDDMQKQLVLQR
jgi:hypothetical protein